jgi:hypothetical protein
VSIAASISWPLSYLITSILANPLRELDSPIPLLVLVGLIAGFMTALVGWIAAGMLFILLTASGLSARARSLVALNR